MRAFIKCIRYIKKFSFSTRGFSMTELMTAAAVMTVLATVGVSSYKTQKSKAAASEAKQSLSTIYSAEKQFYETWNTYHENLVLIGAVPIGQVNYDGGFNSNNIALVEGIPQSLTEDKAYVQSSDCTTWEKICSGDCAAATMHLDKSYFNCAVGSSEYVRTVTPVNTYDADATMFKVGVRGVLNSEDRWSIDQDQTIVHEVDGTN